MLLPLLLLLWLPALESLLGPDWRIVAYGLCFCLYTARIRATFPSAIFFQNFPPQLLYLVVVVAMLIYAQDPSRVDNNFVSLTFDFETSN